MCFAEPGRIVSTDGSMASVATGAGNVDVGLVVLVAQGEHVVVGDWVVVALGLAIERITEQDGRRLADERRVLLEDAGRHVG